MCGEKHFVVKYVSEDDFETYAMPIIAESKEKAIEGVQTICGWRNEKIHITIVFTPMIFKE